MNKNKIAYNNLTIRRCLLEDVNDIMMFQDNIFKSLENANWLRKNNKEMFIKCINDPNITFGVFFEKKLIAIIIMYAVQDEEDLSRCLVNTKANNSANFKLILVDERYRGNGLMKSLMWILEKYAYKTGHSYLCATADGENLYSTNNLVQSNYQKDSLTVKYGGLARELYVKDIEKYQKEYIDSLDSVSNLEKLKEYCFLGDIDIANYGDIVEYNNKLGIIYPDEKIRFEDGELLSINDLKDIKIWVNTNYENI